MSSGYCIQTVFVYGKGQGEKGSAPEVTKIVSPNANFRNDRNIGIILLSFS